MLIPALALLAIAFYLAATGLLARPLLGGGEPLNRSAGGAAALAVNDSGAFFEALGDAIVTGPTGTNVNDLRVILIE